MFIAGFAVMKALATDSIAPEKASRPFDRAGPDSCSAKGRHVVLEDYEHARRRAARRFTPSLGFASSNDAYHPIAPRPEGLARPRAVRDALKDAGV